MQYPVPTGDMKLMPITDAILMSKAARGGASEDEMSKVKMIENFIKNNYYCKSLKKRGLSTCEDPVSKKEEVKPKELEEKNYVYKLDRDPYEYWDYQGDDINNRRFCHGTVAVSKGFKADNKYNFLKYKGFYKCNSILSQGLPGDEPTRCWCNPNYEWDKYVEPKPERTCCRGLGNLPYENWAIKAKLDETRPCNGLVTFVNMSKTVTNKFQNAIVKEING